MSKFRKIYLTIEVLEDTSQEFIDEFEREGIKNSIANIQFCNFDSMGDSIDDIYLDGDVINLKVEKIVYRELMNKEGK